MKVVDQKTGSDLDPQVTLIAILVSHRLGIRREDTVFHTGSKHLK